MLSFGEEGWGRVGDGDTLQRLPLDWKILFKPFLANGDLRPEDNRSTQVLCPYPLGLGPQGLTWRGAEEPGHEKAQGGHIGSQKQSPGLLHQ